MYAPGTKPTIVISVERPAGRRRHTCGHELGHHVFGHGISLDQLTEATNDVWTPEEFIADRFSSALLMPKLAVTSAITRRHWAASTLTPEQALIVAQDLGVGYTNLIGNLERTLRLISTAASQSLRRSGSRLPRVRRGIAGFDIDHDLFVADEHWGTRPLDIEIGDTVLIPSTTVFEGSCLETVDEPVPHLRAARSGEGLLVTSMGDRPTPVRVSRLRFTGLARYRHLEDPDDA